MGWLMSKWRSLIVAAVVSVFSVPPAAHAITAATETFTFTGTCTIDCTGDAYGVLSLQNYTVGTSLTDANFVSFQYTVFPLPLHQ